MWDNFAAKYAEECRDSDGLIGCGGRLHSPECPGRLPRPDLHHKISKAQRPDLYFNKQNLIWVYRGCHGILHQGSAIQQGEQSKTSKKGEPNNLYKVRESSPVRGSSPLAAENNSGSSQTLYSTRSSRNDHLLPRQATRPRSVFDTRHTTESRGIRE